MLGIKFKDVILETIDQLRKRKARPDLDRISNMLQRKHGISFEDTEAILEKLVDSEVVFKVDYKGSTSYRNAAKWRINHIGGQVHNSNQSNQKIRALGQQPSNNSTSTTDVMNVSESVVSPGNRKNSSNRSHVNVVDTKELNPTSTTSSDSHLDKAASNYQCSENKAGNRGTKKTNVNVTTTATILTTSSPCYTSTLSTRQIGRNSRKEQASSKTTNTNVKRNTENWQCKENKLTETTAFADTQNEKESEWDKKLLINDNSSGDAVMTDTFTENDSNNKNNDNNSNERHSSCTLSARQTVHRKNMNNTLIARIVNNYKADSNNNNANGNDKNGISSSSDVEDCNGGGGGDDINTSCNKFKKAIGTSHFPSSAELVHDALSKLKSSLSSCVTVTTAGVTDASKSSPSIGSCQGRRENRQQSAVLSKLGHPCREKQLQNKVSLSTTNAQPRGNRMTKTATPVAPVLARRGRPVSKRKRIRKTHGPEFESEDILKFDQEKCVSCLLTADRNKHGQPEELLVCKDCNTTVHPSCMDYCEELATKARNSPWQCIECKTCFICDDSGDGDCMLFCDACDKGYHMKCHLPRVNEKPKGKWVCGQCASESENCLAQPMEFETATPEESSMPTTNGNHRDNMETTSPPGLPTPQDSPAQPEPEDKPCVKEEPVSLPMLRDFQGPYPDAANWSIDDVVNFFKSAGFVTQAEAFREQEIDGKSLLLMKRSDVLTGLSLKLGPALKMYTHVQNLQLVGQSSYVNGTGH
ncbi:histone acetyltransferase KAT6B-like [Octopus vulgaris]|uniref:Histone acetyltransferase KAT6B-like n=1 Tax=Octopus vulgaris TaxID=6645 RepID=A0AA36ASW6_OCTVU|nr:histone acetyltransferase KAT6B-like [Octopus vulgaris]